MRWVSVPDNTAATTTPVAALLFLKAMLHHVLSHPQDDAMLDALTMWLAQPPLVPDDIIPMYSPIEIQHALDKVNFVIAQELNNDSYGD